MSIDPQRTIIDPEAIENLRALGEEGDDSFLREIIGIYNEDIPSRLNDLTVALAKDDRSLFTRSAHTIKGSSSNLGAEEVRALAASLEMRSKGEPLANLAAELPPLAAAFARAKSSLLQLIP